MSDDLQQALAGVRTEIDRIDSALLKLLNDRARCAQRVGEIKAEHGEAGHIYRPEREAQVYVVCRTPIQARYPTKTSPSFSVR